MSNLEDEIEEVKDFFLVDPDRLQNISSVGMVTIDLNEEGDFEDILQRTKLDFKKVITKGLIQALNTITPTSKIEVHFVRDADELIREIDITEDEGKIRTLQGVVLNVPPEKGSRTLTAKFNCISCDIMDIFTYKVDKPQCSDCGKKMIFEENVTSQPYMRATVSEEIRDSRETTDNIIPKPIPVDFVYEDANNIELSDHVKITGVVRSIPLEKRSGQKRSANMVIVEAIFTEIDDRHITKPTEEEMEKFMTLKKEGKLVKKITNTYAYNILYRDTEKLLALLSIVGGNDNELEHGLINIYLIGEGGTGKTQILQYAEKVTPIFEITNGIAATEAGLFAGMVTLQPDNRNVVMPGVIVKNHGGGVYIDEIEKSKDMKALNLLYLQMVKDVVERPLAGIHFKANAKTFIMASSNPKFDVWVVGETVRYNLPIKDTLLQRFDTKIRLMPITDKKKKKEILEWIKKCRKERPEGILNDAELMAYLNHAREKKPEMTDEADDIITEYLLTLGDDEEGSTVNFRNDSAVTKYAQAYAKLLNDDKVTKEHAEKAIELYNFGFESFGLKAGGLDKGSVALRDSNKDRDRAVKIAFDKLKEERGDVFYKEDLVDELNNRLMYTNFKDKDQVIETVERANSEPNRVLEITKRGIRWLD